MKKDYSISEPVSLEWINSAIELSKGETYEIDGGLNSAYLIDFSGLRYGRVRRHWLIVVPEYANEWDNKPHALLTDDDSKAKQFINEYEKQQDSYNEEGEPGYDENAGEYRYYPELAGVFMKTLDQISMDELNKYILKK